NPSFAPAKSRSVPARTHSSAVRFSEHLNPSFAPAKSRSVPARTHSSAVRFSEQFKSEFCVSKISQRACTHTL
ncbi:hypothetical protein, partial [uncultured Treponema sp.]|uniref:hypothetical protein n=1 Tax=uncultured Treponema sp. TaxID=162155 RepID=UPI0025E69634